jgi:hypothetical protein
MLSFLPDQEPPPHSTPPCTLICQAKSTEWFLEEKAFSLSDDLSPPPPPGSPHLLVSSTWATHMKIDKERQLADRGRSQIIRLRESLVLYESFKTLGCQATNSNCLARSEYPLWSFTMSYEVTLTSSAGLCNGLKGTVAWDCFLA